MQDQATSSAAFHLQYPYLVEALYHEGGISLNPLLATPLGFTPEVIHSLVAELPYEQTVGADGIVKRSSTWFTNNNCFCKYKYDGSSAWTPIPFPVWMQPIASRLAALPNPRKYTLDGCFANWYQDGTECLGWHSDDEKLFATSTGDLTIVSLTLGATQPFGIKQNALVTRMPFMRYCIQGTLL